jgi:hypothetical protein
VTRAASPTKTADRDRLDRAQTTALLAAAALVGLALCTVAVATIGWLAGVSVSAASVDAVLSEGPVTISWTGVPGATAHEYLVMEPGERRPTVRGVTTESSVQVELRVHGDSTHSSAIVRACPAGAACRGGRDRGWGPWSTEAGTGAVNFTVISPDPHSGIKP